METIMRSLCYFSRVSFGGVADMKFVEVQRRRAGGGEGGAARGGLSVGCNLERSHTELISQCKRFNKPEKHPLFLIRARSAFVWPSIF